MPEDRREPPRRERSREEQGPPPEASEVIEESEFSLSNILRILWAHMPMLAFTTILGTALAAFHVYTETPLYTAEARIVLDTKEEKLVQFEGVVPQLSGDDQAMNTELLSLRSHDLMLRVVDTMDLTGDPEFNPSLRPPDAWKELPGYEALMTAIGRPPSPSVAPAPEEARTTAADILRGKVQASIVPSTYAFNISVQTSEAKKSAAIANTIAEIYVERQREAKFQAMEEASTWLGTRAVDLKDELEAAEARVEEFTASATAVNEETVARNTQRLKNMRARRDEQQERARTLRQQTAELERLGAEDDYQALATTSDDPEIRSLARDLAAGEAPSGAAARIDRAIARRVSRLSAEAARLEGQAESFEAPIAELAAEVDAQSSDLLQLRQLQREAEATRLVYEHFLARMKEVSVQEGIQQADSRVLESARPPGAPSYPNRASALARGGVFGLVFGIALVSVGRALRNTMETPEELEVAAGISVIGVIPEQPGNDPTALLARLVEKPGSAMAEAVRNLRTAIQLSNVDAPPQVVMLTSSVPEEGKTILAAALAQTTAMSGRRVLLVEADLRRRRLNQYFELESEPGLISLLSGGVSFEEAVVHDDTTNLDILLAEESKVTPVDLFDSQSFRNFLDEMRKIYDLVVLDTPPILAVPDARVIAQHSDAVVYVVRWKKTTRRMVQSGLDFFHQVNLRVTGLSLNRINPKRMDRYGYYGYGYGYGRSGIGKYYTN